MDTQLKRRQGRGGRLFSGRWETADRCLQLQLFSQVFSLGVNFEQV